jgi:hypothetical protein
MSAPPVICADCGYIGSPGKRVKGSTLVERLLWWVLLIPGPFYSLWRKSGRRKICAKCGSQSLIPFETPQGQRLLEQNLAKLETNKKAR